MTEAIALRRPDRPHARSARGRPAGARTLTTLVLLVAGLGAVTACGGGPVGPAGPAGRTYVATAVIGHDLVDGTSVRLSFEDGQISAEAGCNTLVGGADWERGTLDIEQLASTRMGCDDDLGAQDQWLSTFLTSSPTFTLDGDTLTLGDETEGMTLTESR